MKVRGIGKGVQEVLDFAAANGFTSERTKRNRFKLTSGSIVVFVAATPGDSRATQNAMALLRRVISKRDGSAA